MKKSGGGAEKKSREVKESERKREWKRRLGGITIDERRSAANIIVRKVRLREEDGVRKFSEFCI